jgi:hypothetical protein
MHHSLFLAVIKKDIHRTDITNKRDKHKNCKCQWISINNFQHDAHPLKIIKLFNAIFKFILYIISIAE